MAIASCLVDTNILLRISRRFDPQYKLVDSALAKLGPGRHDSALHAPEHRRTVECHDTTR